MKIRLFAKLTSKETDPSRNGYIPKHRRHQYVAQGDDLEFAIQAIDGEVKFSRFISEFSGFFNVVCQNRIKENFKDGPIRYDGTEGSLAFKKDTIKAFWDIAHGQDVDLGMLTVLDLVRFLCFEGKAEQEDGFERDMLDFLTESLMSNEIGNEDKLVNSWLISTFHDPAVFFEKKLAETVACDQVKELAWNWESSDVTNKAIVEYYSYIKGLEFDEAGREMSKEILFYSKNFVKKYYTEVLSVVIGDSKYKDREGDFVKFGSHNGRDSFKRVDGPDMFIFMYTDTSRKNYWIIGSVLGESTNSFNYVISDALSPPETGWTRQTQLTKKKRIFDVKWANV